MYGNNINILYNYNTNFHHVIKCSLTWVLNFRDLFFESFMIFMRVINNKVGAIEQIFMLDPTYQVKHSWLY